MYFIDVQGTLIDDIDRKPIKGAVEFVNSLKNSGIPFVLITNNTKYSTVDFMSYLRGLGFRFDDKEYLDPFATLKDFVDNKKIWAIGNDGFISALREFGYRFDTRNPDFLIMSLKEKLSYDEMAEAVELILGGAKLIGMHETAIYAKNGRKYPGLGAILRALEYATNTKARIVGKPSEDFYDEARKLLGADKYEDICIISDDVIGDLVGAKKLGMKTVLVLSGKYKSADEIIPFLPEGDRPCEIYGSIAEIKIQTNLLKVNRCRH